MWGSVSSEPTARSGSLRRQLVVLSAAVTALAAVAAHAARPAGAGADLDRLGQPGPPGSLRRRGRPRSRRRPRAPRSSSPTPTSRPVSRCTTTPGALVAGSAPSAIADVYADLSTTTEPTVTREIEDSDRVRAQPFTPRPRGVRGVVVVDRTAPALRGGRAVRPGGQRRDRSAGGRRLGPARRVGEPTRAAAGACAWRPRPRSGASTTWVDVSTSARPPTRSPRWAATLDGLLDKVSAAIRSEQRLTSELAHELRTPLTAVQGTAGLMLLRPDLDDDLREDVRGDPRRDPTDGGDHHRPARAGPLDVQPGRRAAVTQLRVGPRARHRAPSDVVLHGRRRHDRHAREPRRAGHRSGDRQRRPGWPSTSRQPRCRPDPASSR